MESLPPRGQEWELIRHEAYQERLAGCPVGETFALASAFLSLVSRALPETGPAKGRSGPAEDPDPRAADGR